MSRKVKINGEARQVEAASLTQLLEELTLNPEARGLAVALNGALAPKTSWAETPVSEGDEIEIVRPVRGG